MAGEYKGQMQGNSGPAGRHLRSVSLLNPVLMGQWNPPGTRVNPLKPMVYNDGKLLESPESFPGKVGIEVLQRRFRGKNVIAGVLTGQFSGKKFM